MVGYTVTWGYASRKIIRELIYVKGFGKSNEKKVRKIIEINVTNISNKFVLIFKLDDANTLGINKKIEKGFKTPPVKYNNELS